MENYIFLKSILKKLGIKNGDFPICKLNELSNLINIKITDYRYRVDNNGRNKSQIRNKNYDMCIFLHKNHYTLLKKPNFKNCELII